MLTRDTVAPDSIREKAVALAKQEQPRVCRRRFRHWVKVFLAPELTMAQKGAKCKTSSEGGNSSFPKKMTLLSMCP